MTVQTVVTAPLVFGTHICTFSLVNKDFLSHKCNCLKLKLEPESELISEVVNIPTPWLIDANPDATEWSSRRDVESI